MSVVVKNNGILATIQDLGRYGFRKSGINPGGAMDRQAVRLINILLGNEENEAVLEMHFPAPILEFTENALIALGGANFTASFEDNPIDNRRPVFVEKGRQLRFLKRIRGNRAYLAVKGGFEIDQWLGSASTNLIAGQGGVRGRSLRTGDEIRFKERCLHKRVKHPFLISNAMFRDRARPHNAIRVVPGAEFGRLTALSKQLFLQNEFAIGPNSNRMGFRLTGQPLELLEASELLSSAVDFGTIQLLPDGQMIILMADHQTTGGYPRIAHVISRDQSALAQLGVRDKVGFELVSISRAEDLIFQNEVGFNYFKLTVRDKNV